MSARQEILPPAEKPRRYRPPGAGDLRDAMLAVAEHFEGERRVAVALAMSLNLLEILGKNSLSPAQKNMCEAYVDAFSDVVPADVRDLLATARKMNREKKEKKG